MTENNDNKEILKTFDMYRFFSRVDVIIILAFVLFLIGYALYAFVLSAPAVI